MASKMQLLLTLSATIGVALSQCTFPRNASGIECWGLTQVPSASTADACADACCAQSGCQTWQFCPIGATCPTPGSCWIGKYSSCKPVAGWIGAATAAALTMNLSAPLPPAVPIPLPGRTASPNGITIGANNMGLTLNGEQWFGLSGEMQYSRAQSAFWKRDLLAMKAGGLDVVGTYVFWNHHEETQGVWNWTGNKDLRTFVTLAGEVGLKVFMRLGPFAHGECFNGGFPNWTLAVPGIQIRSNTTIFMGLVQQLYAQVAQQLEGLYWYQGGPVIGAQVDNEWGGDYTYLLALRDLAMAEGILPAFFTKTGWPTASQPFATFLPEFGGYSDNFWDRTTAPNQPDSFAVFMFAPIGNDTNNAGYPKLTVEVGGGMATSYHRRVRLWPADITTPAFIFAGSGCASLGYYIYHGGTHPMGSSSTLQEQQFGYAGYNDMPVRNYDFNAPIGYQGQLHAHYHGLRRLHLALSTWGSWLSAMPAYSPDSVVTDYTDTTDLRWAARSDGMSGLLFLTTYQRNTSMSAVPNATLLLARADGSTLTLPPNPAATGPVTIPANTTALLPFGVPADYGSATAGSFTLGYAYATLLASLPILPTPGAPLAATALLLSLTPGLPNEVAFYDPASQLSVQGAYPASREGPYLVFRGLDYWGSTPSSSAPGTYGLPSAEVKNSTNGALLKLVLLSDSLSYQVYMQPLNGARAVFMAGDSATSVAVEPGSPVYPPSPPSSSSAGRQVGVQGDVLHVKYTDVAGQAAGTAVQFGLLSSVSAPASLSCSTVGLLQWCSAGSVPPPSLQVQAELKAAAGPARAVPLGPAGVAQEPNGDGGYDAWLGAATYSVSLSPGTAPGTRSPTDPAVDIHLSMHWVGDVARLYPGPWTGPGTVYSRDALLADCFYNTDECTFPFSRLEGASTPSTALTDGLLLKLLPLAQDAPIYLPYWPAFPPGQNSTQQLLSLQAVQTTTFDVQF